VLFDSRYVDVDAEQPSAPAVIGEFALSTTQRSNEVVSQPSTQLPQPPESSSETAAAAVEAVTEHRKEVQQTVSAAATSASELPAAVPGDDVTTSQTQTVPSQLTQVHV